MRYVKKKYDNNEGTQISWWSTDDNILCEDGKLLRDSLNSKLPVDIAIVDNKLCAVDKTGKAIGTGLTADQVKMFLGIYEN